MARSRRYEFSKATKREALQRSGKLCEAVGSVYGLPPGQRCNAPLDGGVEFDHYPAPATDKGSDTIENCVACCKTCHRFKTSNFDVPVQAKTKRVSDKHQGIARPKHNWGRQRLGNGNQQRSAMPASTMRTYTARVCLDLMMRASASSGVMGAHHDQASSIHARRYFQGAQGCQGRRAQPHKHRRGAVRQDRCAVRKFRE